MNPDQCTCADCETTRAIAGRARRDRHASRGTLPDAQDAREFYFPPGDDELVADVLRSRAPDGRGSPLLTVSSQTGRPGARSHSLPFRRAWLEHLRRVAELLR